MLQLDELATVAAAASPGPWTVTEGRYGDQELRHAGGDFVVSCSSYEECEVAIDPPDVAHLVAFHPRVTAALVRVAQLAWMDDEPCQSHADYVPHCIVCNMHAALAQLGAVIT